MADGNVQETPPFWTGPDAPQAKGTVAGAQAAATKAVVVVLSKNDTEFDTFQGLERAGVMIGGVLGEALLEMLAPHKADVLARAKSDVE